LSRCGRKELLQQGLPVARMLAEALQVARQASQA
jgi:hypothetical protein